MTAESSLIEGTRTSLGVISVQYAPNYSNSGYLALAKSLTHLSRICNLVNESDLSVLVIGIIKDDNTVYIEATWVITEELRWPGRGNAFLAGMLRWYVSHRTGVRK